MNDEQNTQPNEVPEAEMKMPVGQANTDTNEPSSIGILLGILIVILVLILGGLYLWGTTLQNTTVPAEVTAPAERPTADENNEPESTNAEADAETLRAVSTSDEVNAIEADLEATDLEAIDRELDAIELELDAALQNVQAI